MLIKLIEYFKDMKKRGKTSNLTFYTVLGVPQTANKDQIHEAYQRFIQTCQTKMQSDPQKLASALKIGAKAFDVLANPETRRVYDAQLQKQELVPPPNVSKELPESNAFSDSNVVEARTDTVRGKERNILVRFVFGFFAWLWGVVRPLAVLTVRIGIIAGVIWVLFFAEFLKEYRTDTINKISAGYLNLMDGNGFNFDISKESLYCQKRQLTLRSMRNERDSVLAVIDKKISRMERNKFSDTLNRTASSTTNSGALANLGKAANQVSKEINAVRSERSSTKARFNANIERYKAKIVACL